MIPAHTAIVCFKLGLVRSKGRRVSSNCPSDLRPASAEKAHMRPRWGGAAPQKNAPAGPVPGSRPSFRAAAARKAKPNRADELPVRPRYRLPTGVAKKITLPVPCTLQCD